jgi:short subunit dehydrogenase-like uncharacterized protein
MSDCVLIYGSTGFTGALIVKELLARGLRPILAGRGSARLQALAKLHRLPHRAAELSDARALRDLLDGVDAVLNAAGPFRKTAPPLLEACLDRGVHYLDVSGEFAVFEALARRGSAAERRGIMVLPGIGFDVVATDCAAALAAALVPGAKSLWLALSGLDAISRGSAATVFDQYGQLVMVRREGRLVKVPPGELIREVDFGCGQQRVTAITWGDVSSAYYTTGIPDITVYYEATPMVELGLRLNRYGSWLFNTPGWKLWQNASVRLLPPGPTSAQRARGGAVVVAQASDGSGKSSCVRIRTPEVYSFTASTSAAVVDRVLAGEFSPGFQTPAGLYGPEYVLSLPGVVRDV